MLKNAEKWRQGKEQHCHNAEKKEKNKHLALTTINTRNTFSLKYKCQRVSFMFGNQL